MRKLSIILTALTISLGVEVAHASDLASQAYAAQQRGDYAAASQLYERAASDPGTRTQQYDLMLSSAEMAMQAGDDPRSESLLSRIPRTALDLQQMTRLKIVQAEIALSRGIAVGALRNLPRDPDAVPSLAAKVEALRARAQFRNGDPVAAVHTLTLRERYLGADPEAVERNRDMIWAGLTATPLPSDAPSRFAALDPLTRGWLELAWDIQQGDRSAILDWERKYPAHPGQQRLAGLEINGQAVPQSDTTADFRQVAPGGSIAVLLPQTGPAATSGNVIASGLLAAWYATPGTRPQMHFYDAGMSADQAVAAYHQAVQAGDSLIIGPLSRDGVAAIDRLGAPAVPMLALNYSDTTPPWGVLEYGLSPEDEAQATALRAISDGRHHALAIVPDSDWGSRVTAALSDTLQAHGGVVADTIRVTPETDLNKEISQLMNVSAAEDRHRALTAILGRRTEFVAQHRHDVDFVFVAVRPDVARLALPMIKFHNGTDLPVYSTSLLYDGVVPEDFVGVRVCDMPWMIDPAASAGNGIPLRPQLEAQFGDIASRQPRLFAMGLDAWALAEQAISGQLSPGQSSLPGHTGWLQVSPQGRVSRQLGCALLTHEGPEPLAADGSTASSNGQPVAPTDPDADMDSSPESDSTATGSNTEPASPQ